MLEGNLPVEKQQEQEIKQQHPYTPTQETDPICNTKDKDCLNRLVSAFGDCA